MSWLINNFGTIIAALVLISIVMAVIAVLIRNKRKGKLSCGCNCAHCATKSSCRKQG